MEGASEGCSWLFLAKSKLEEKPRSIGAVNVLMKPTERPGTTCIVVLSTLSIP
jgi:hypothetical protein